MENKLKELKKEWLELNTIYKNEYGGKSNGIQYGSYGSVDSLLDRLREIEMTFRTLDLNVIYYKTESNNINNKIKKDVYYDSNGNRID